MKDKIFGVLQRVGRSFMLPIAILPVAGLLLGLGGSLTNETMLETYGLMGVMGPGTFLNAVFQVMSDAGNIVFANLPIIFAMGVAIGMAKKRKRSRSAGSGNRIFYYACVYWRYDCKSWRRGPDAERRYRIGMRHYISADGRVWRNFGRSWRSGAA